MFWLGDGYRKPSQGHAIANRGALLPKRTLSITLGKTKRLTEGERFEEECTFKLSLANQRARSGGNELWKGRFLFSIPTYAVGVCTV